MPNAMHSAVTSVERNHNDRIWTLGFGPALIAYSGTLFSLGALRWEHISVVGLALTLNYIPRTRPLMKLLLPLVLFAIAYDGLRFITPMMHGMRPIHVLEPYQMELAWFGVGSTLDGTRMTLCQWFQSHTSIWLDLTSAFAYCFFIFEAIIFAFFLGVFHKPVLRHFAWAFLITNLLGFITYYAYPAAPPWYVLSHGFGPVILNTPGNPARLLAVDAFLGIHYFENFYSRTSNVFAALPSLHVAYPLLVWRYGQTLWPRAHWLLMLFWLQVCFAAVYLGHHYVIDVALGVLYAACTYLGVETWFRWRGLPLPRVMRPHKAPRPA